MTDEWMSDALCAQTAPDLFFPRKGDSSLLAKQICSACPVMAECLEYALGMQPQHGIWAGLSVEDLRRLRRDAA